MEQLHPITIWNLILSETKHLSVESHALLNRLQMIKTLTLNSKYEVVIDTKKKKKCGDNETEVTAQVTQSLADEFKDSSSGSVSQTFSFPHKYQLRHASRRGWRSPDEFELSPNYFQSNVNAQWCFWRQIRRSRQHPPLGQSGYLADFQPLRQTSFACFPETGAKVCVCAC